MTDKHLNDMERRAEVYDIERGKAANILPQPWETDTCIGSWHYDQAIFEQHRYKTAANVIPMLADIVSKNGNLMLSVPLQRDGTPDSDEIKIVSDIGAWLKVNGDAIYATRPWKIYGEGPSTETAEKGPFGGQRDVQKTPFTAGGHPFHAVQGWQETLCHRPRDSRRRQSHHQIARQQFAELAGQDRQRPAARTLGQIEIHPRRKWPARHAAAKSSRARSRSR